MLRRLYCLAAVLLACAASPPPAFAQHFAVHPLTVVAGDTADHADLAFRPAIHGHDRTSLVAVSHDSAGRLLTGQAVVWTSADSRVAVVDGTSAVATVVARGYGFTWVRAQSGTQRDSLPVCVSGPSDPNAVTVAPASALLGGPGLPQQVQFHLLRGLTLVPVQCVHWSLDQPQLGVVSRRGLVTAKAVGKFTLTGHVGLP